MADLAALLRECVVQVIDDGFRGSGFFVAPGLVISCAHVVDGASGPLRVVWQGRELPVGAVRMFPEQRGAGTHYPLPDMVLLRVTESAGQGSVWLGQSSPAIGAELIGVGFSSDSPAGAVATDSILVTTVGPAGDGFLKIKNDRVPAGMSGSPLLDRVSGRVCGMLKASRDYHCSEGGWIVPIEVIVSYLPEVAAVNVLAHPPGEAWRDMATDRAGWTRRLFGDADPAAVPDVPRNPRPSWWLEPRHQVVDFHPRPELEQLQRWCQDAASEQVVRLIMAPGGVGKTRLGLQLCRQMQGKGWIAGLLRSGASLDVMIGEVLAGAVKAGHRILVVIDYAETFTRDLPQVVASLLRCPASSIRVLLLARNTGRWWESLAADAACGHLIDTNPLALSNLGDDVLYNRQAVLTGAYRVFIRLILANQTKDDGQVPQELLALADQHSTILSLHALALNHVLNCLTPQPSPERHALQGIVMHERRYWQQMATRAGIAFDPTDRLADQVLLVPTLYSARGFADAEATLARIPHLLDRFPGQIEDLTMALASVYPNTNPHRYRYWDPLQPDRLGEILLTEVLADHPSDERAVSFLQTLLANADIGQAMQALTVLVRISGEATSTRPPPNTGTAGAQRAVRAIEALLTHHPPFLSAAVMIAATIRTPARLLSQIEAAQSRMPPAVREWAEVTIKYTEELVQLLRQERITACAAADAKLASSLDDLAVRLAAGGRWEEALAPIQDAVGIRRRLAQDNPAAYLPDLADSLDDLGVRLAETGRWQEALTPSEDAVAIYRRLAQDNPAIYLSKLALSLDSLGIQLNGAGRWGEAEAAWKESADLLPE